MWAAVVGLLALAFGLWCVERASRVRGLYVRCWRCDRAIIDETEPGVGYEGAGKRVCPACVVWFGVRPWEGPKL